MQQQKLLILFTPAFPSSESESYLVPLVQTFIKSINKQQPDLNVVVFSFQYPYSNTMYAWNGNTIYPFNGMHKNKLERFFMWLRIFNRFRKIKKEYAVMGVFSFWCNECAFFGKYLSRLYGFKHFSWILGGDALPNNQWVKRIKPKENELIGLSDFVADQFFKSHGVKPKFVIPPGIDIAAFEKYTSNKDVDIIGVGTLSYIKRYDLFVDIVAEIKKELPSIKAMLCGDGEDKERVLDKILKFDLIENIIYTGTVQHLQSLKMMQRAKVLLHTSNYEGFGIVCIEALYAGAHVISFVKPMNNTIKNWHIVTTAQEMKEKAIELLTSPSIIYQPELVYSADDMTRSIIDLYN